PGGAAPAGRRDLRRSDARGKLPRRPRPGEGRTPRGGSMAREEDCAMPLTVTYPGVYVEELPAGTHMITGVATSTAAFAGRTAAGPVGSPVTLHSWGDYIRT